jgi:threonine synthase
MRLLSTRGGDREPSVSFSEALVRGLAPDGGLYLPTEIPTLDRSQLDALRGGTFSDTAVAVAQHLLGDELDLGLIKGVVRDALDFPMPLVPLEDGVHVLELFHGPTLAFKDVGARFMARMLAALRPGGAAGPITILVATSGDTGGAVADAFLGVPGTRVVVLFPKGRVSTLQEVQFTTLGGNVTAVEVSGVFDDCQRLVKQAFADEALGHAIGISSANSINIGRLIPQTFYYAHAWASHPRSPAPLTIAVPSGNFGNLTAGIMAQRMGIPIRHFVAATNANDVVPAYLTTGHFEARPSVATLSTAMDVGDPSNLERMRQLFGDDVQAMRQVIHGSAWTDEDTSVCIRDTWDRHGVVIDPHTAVALLGLRDCKLRQPGVSGAMSGAMSDSVSGEVPGGVPGVVLSTAHPAKFAETVEPLLGHEIPLPPALAGRLEGERRVVSIGAEWEPLRELLLKL